MICSPQFVGGADASQNGLRHGMPQNVVSSVGLGLDMFSLQPRGNTDASAFSVRNCVHNLATAVRAISARKKLWVRCLACNTVNKDTSAFKLHLRGFTSESGEKVRMCALPDRQKNQICHERKLRAFLWNE